MPCKLITDAEGSFRGFVCSRGTRKPAACSVCGYPSSKLCDGDKGHGMTCDAPLCARCAKHVEPNHDYCPKCTPNVTNLPERKR